MREISEKEIEQVENLLLHEGDHFDSPRREIIRCLDSKNIKACPGSGKTTILLAKLLILANRMPFADGRGICVLTHTNVAIDEIRNRLGSRCDVLFTYPNFFGTIQSFVDKYLAFPYFAQRFKERPKAVDDDIYKQKINELCFKYSSLEKGQFSSQDIKNVRYFFKSYSGRIDLLTSYRLDYSNSDELICTDKINGKEVQIKGKKDFTDCEKKQIKKWMRGAKIKVMCKYGVLCYDDSYILAKTYIRKNENKLQRVFSRRFKYLFIDEMQDTAGHQYEIIEQLFDNKTIIQRYGDPYQSIINESIEKNGYCWKCDNEVTLQMPQSKRFGTSIARRLQTVCVEHYAELQGNENVPSLQPHMLVFNDDTRAGVLEQFARLIVSHGLDDFGKHEKQRPFKAVGRIGKKNEIEKRLSIGSYYNEYNPDITKKTGKIKLYRPNLISYLCRQPDDVIRKQGVRIYHDNIVNSVVRVINMARSGGMGYFTANTLVRYLEKDNEQKYYELRRKIAEWAGEIHNQAELINEVVYEDVKKYFRKWLPELFPNINISAPDIISFMDNRELLEENKGVQRCYNEYISAKYPRVKIKIDNVHSVKGETHRATLYLDTFFHKYQSELLLDFLMGNHDAEKSKGQRVREALKIAYVAMSRPTHLFCMAIHEDIVGEYRQQMEDAGWIWSVVGTE